MRINREALRAIRERSGYSVPALAKEIGRSHGTLYDIEHGKRDASEHLICELAQALKVPIPALISAPDEESCRCEVGV